MRDTNYAKEIATAAIGNSRIERLYVKKEKQEEIRLSWWPGGKSMANRPLDVTEEEFIALVAEGIRKNVLSAQFLPKLIVAAARDRSE